MIPGGRRRGDAQGPARVAAGEAARAARTRESCRVFASFAGLPAFRRPAAPSAWLGLFLSFSLGSFLSSRGVATRIVEAPMSHMLRVAVTAASLLTCPA